MVVATEMTMGEKWTECGTPVQSIQLGRKPTDEEIANEVKAMKKREREEALLVKKQKAAESRDHDRGRMEKLEDLCAAQDERLKKVEDMLYQLHAKLQHMTKPKEKKKRTVAKEKSTKRRTVDSKEDTRLLEDLGTGEASEGRTESGEALEGTGMEPEEDASTELVTGKKVAEVAIEAKEGAATDDDASEGATMDTDTEDVKNPSTEGGESAPTPTAQNVDQDLLDFNSMTQAPEKEKVPFETANEHQVVEPMAQLSTDSPAQDQV